MNADQNNIDLKRLQRLLRRYLSLNIENIRLSLTERLTLLMGAVSFAFVALVLCSIGLVFLTGSIANILRSHMAVQWAYMIVAGIYFALTVIIFVFRVSIIYNPICKFLSRLILTPPEEKESGNNTPQKKSVMKPQRLTDFNRPDSREWNGHNLEDLRFQMALNHARREVLNSQIKAFSEEISKGKMMRTMRGGIISKLMSSLNYLDYIVLAFNVFSKARRIFSHGRR